MARSAGAPVGGERATHRDVDLAATTSSHP
jgi:hypothetical protein